MFNFNQVFEHLFGLVAPRGAIFVLFVHNFRNNFPASQHLKMPSSGEGVTNGVCRCAGGSVGYKGE